MSVEGGGEGGGFVCFTTCEENGNGARFYKYCILNTMQSVFCLSCDPMVQF